MEEYSVELKILIDETIGKVVELLNRRALTRDYMKGWIPQNVPSYSNVFEVVIASQEYPVQCSLVFDFSAQGKVVTISFNSTPDWSILKTRFVRELESELDELENEVACTYRSLNLQLRERNKGTLDYMGVVLGSPKVGFCEDTEEMTVEIPCWVTPRKRAVAVRMEGEGTNE